MKKVLALIGDIVLSKKIEDRAIFQTNLNKQFKKISKASKPFLLSPFTVTLGDEFQAVYEKPDSILRDIWKIIETIYPHQARFSLGIDKLTTNINPMKAIGMDGPAFYLARDGINELKKSSKTIIQFYSPYISNLTLINHFFILLSGISEKWKLNSIKILNGLMNEDSLDKISRNTGISIRAIYKNIRGNNLDHIINLQTEITDSLSHSIESL
jgi:hypothetical protein